MTSSHQTQSLAGRRAVITGSTSGIGLAIAQKLASEGADIMLNGIESLESQISHSEALAQQYDTKVTYSNADMRSPEKIAEMIQQAQQELGGVDILVNNAGIQHVSPIEDFPTSRWDDIIAINLSAAFHTAQHAIPMMRSAGWGRIINIASAHALTASPYKSAYVAAKHGVLGLTRTLALELATDNITCNAICPGYVRTPLVENQLADTAKARGISLDTVIDEVILAAHPTGQFIEMSEVAEYAAFLCQESAKNITGNAQVIDGGWMAR